MGGEVADVGDGEGDVGGELVGAVKGRGAFVALDGVFFFGGHVVGISVGGAAEDDERGGGGDGLGRGGGTDGGSPAAAGHGGCFAGGDDDDELADAEELDVDDVGGPLIWDAELACVQEDGFRVLAGNLGCGWGFDQGADDGPERVCV